MTAALTHAAAAEAAAAPRDACSAAPLHAVVLAAGASRRFAGIKALAPIDGKPMLQWVIDALSSAGVDGLSIVLGAYAAEISAGIDPRGASLVRHEDWTEGLAASLRAGLASVQSADAGLLIALADQPDIGIDDYRRLIAAWRAAPDKAAAAAYAHTRGAPCIVPAAVRPALLHLHGDQGARVLLRTLTDVIEVPMDSAARDVDTRDEWQARVNEPPVRPFTQSSELPTRS
jgi:molybdenum cofactor cytidylyltransferase